MQVQGNHRIISSFDRSGQVAGGCWEVLAGLGRSWASDLRRYACGGDGLVSLVVVGGLGSGVVSQKPRFAPLHPMLRSRFDGNPTAFEPLNRTYHALAA